MKKILSLLSVVVLSLALFGCGKKDEITTASCKTNEDNMEMTFDLTATNDEINKVKLTMIPDNSLFGVESLDILDDEQKETVKTTMLSNLGLDGNTNEGMTIEIDINDTMIIKIDADLETADPETLKKVGMDFDGADMSLEKAIKDMKADGFTCK